MKALHAMLSIKSGGILLASFLVAVHSSSASEPSPFALAVFRRDSSNLVFVVSNTSGKPIRLPTGGYVPASDLLETTRTNDQVITAAHFGLCLTDDPRWWRPGQTNRTLEGRAAELAPTNIPPGHSITIERRLGWSEVDLRKIPVEFRFDIDREIAARYGLSAGSATTTNWSGEPDEGEVVAKLVESNGLYNIEIKVVPRVHSDSK